jgi:uncharacterized membrane protein
VEIKQLKQINPIVAFLFVFITFGVYLLYWGQYLADNLNQITESKIVDKSKLKKLFTIIFVTFLVIFGVLMTIGPVSFSNVNEGTATIITIIFYIGFTLASLWIAGIIYYFCYINYKIDRLLEANNAKFTSPFLSICITIIFFFIFFLFVPFTQYKMNSLIKISSMKKEIPILKNK